MTRFVAFTTTSDEICVEHRIPARTRAVCLLWHFDCYHDLNEVVHSLDIQYHALRLAFEDKPFLAPIDSPAAVLDVGTGTGEVSTDLY